VASLAICSTATPARATEVNRVAIRPRASGPTSPDIALLRKAIGTFEDEIANALPIADKQRAVAAAQESKTPHKAGDVPTLPGQVGGGLDLKAVWGRVGQWWRGGA
jgi:hypothetical protein